jgi:hypothetical protein
MVILPRFGTRMLENLSACIKLDINDFLSIKMKEIKESKTSSTLVTKSEMLFLFGNIFSNYLCSKRSVIS